MGQNFNKRCARCGQFGVETFDTYEDGTIDDLMCPRCNDLLIDHANERAEWNYYHPPIQFKSTDN